jgi:anti-sigma B factor antagonist
VVVKDTVARGQLGWHAEAARFGHCPFIQFVLTLIEGTRESEARMWNLSVESMAGWPLLRLSGQLVQGPPSESLTTAMHELIGQGHLAVVCDASGVEAIDSTGMGVLVAAREMVHRAGGRLVLYQPSRRLRAVLHTTHLVGLFDVADDESTALETLRSPLPGDVRV